MSKRKLVSLGLIITGAVILIAFGIFAFFRSRKPTAGLKVETNPPSLVFVDNVESGRTPFDKHFSPTEVVVKLIPDSSSTSLATYQTKVRLTDQVYTVIRRDFGPTDSESAGEIVTLQPQSARSPGLAVITSAPDSASVTLDGEPQGFTPLLIPSLPEGDHQITITAPGFTPRTISAQAQAFYKLTLNVKLASLSQAQLTPTSTPASLSGTPTSTPPTSQPSIRPGTPTPTPKTVATPTPTPALAKPYVTILNTPVGFLRVRSGPGTNFSEVGQVEPGSSFPLKSSASGWYLIEADLTATSSGWITSQYASKTE